MNVQNLIISSIGHSVVQVFETMLGVAIVPGEVFTERSTPEATDCVVSFIGVAGNWSGTGSLTCSSDLACRICSQMLMMDAPSLNEEVLDAVAELTNMVIGNVKTELERYVGELGLSIPTVVFGRNFKTKTGAALEWIVQKFHWDDSELLVKVCLAPTEKIPHNAPHSVSQICPVEI